ncbi:MAG: hypothetical protein C4518_03005, partial [Desulfobacteraceae bacterium]
MNFFEHQEQSKRNTFKLIVLMILAVSAIVISVYAAVMVAFYTQDITLSAGGGPAAWFDPSVFSGVALVVLTLIMGGSFVKLIALRRGGSYVAESLGGRRILPETHDIKEKRLINVVEEMALSAGMAVPAAYVLDQEQGINAFAAGHSPSDAVVAVTSGCLNQLSRDELQGVVAHEFSHILNGDMNLNLRLIGMVSGIMVLATAGRIVLQGTRTSRNSKSSGPILMLGLMLIIIGYAGVLAARIIQSAVSRQREYLADASAVQFTRNPSGIANALKKIGGFMKGSIVRAPLAGEASHMFFGSAIATLFATHPPLKDRIRRIDPGFSGDFAAISAPGDIATEEFATEKLSPEYLSSQNRSMDADAWLSSFSGTSPAMRIVPGQVSETVGTIDPEQVRHSAMLLQTIPSDIRRELNDALGASS